MVVGDVLDITRIDAGRMILVYKPVPLRQMATEWQHSLSLLAENKGITLYVRTDPRLPDTVHTDPDTVTKIVTNLLNNAIKFTDEGSVTLALEVGEDDALRLVVSDTGIGIPEAAHELIFEEFRQADQSSARQYGGTGLGLAIVQRLVHLMGGDIHLESAPGQGSTFTVILPFQVPHMTP